MFKIGDKVKALENPHYSITTNGWEGVVTHINGKEITVKGSTGAEYEVEAKYFTLIKPKETKTTKAMPTKIESKKRTKYIAEFDINKNGTDIILKLKTAPIIESFFAAIDNAGEETSTRWKDENGNGLVFHKRGDKLQEFMESLPKELHVFDNFGTGMIDSRGDSQHVNGRIEKPINMAIFRIKGIGEGISFNVSEVIGLEDLKRAVERFGIIAKYIFINYIAKQRIKAKISYEI